VGDDPYLDMIDERWDSIVLVYDTFRGKDQIIEFDVLEQKIYSYPICSRHETRSVPVVHPRRREPTAEVICVRCA
jgi:hypothetical protein